MSRVGVLSRLHNAVGNVATYIWLRQSLVAISFERCRYFLAHVACRNLPWQGLLSVRVVSTFRVRLEPVLYRISWLPVDLHNINKYEKTTVSLTDLPN